MGLFLIILLCVFLFLFILEQFAKKRERNIKNKGLQKYLILKEQRIGKKRVICTNTKYIAYPCVKGSVMENKKVVFRTDKDGFIEPGIMYEKADLNIAFVGDSTTECAIVDPDLRYPYLTAKLLQKEKNITVNSYNAGISRASSVDMLTTVVYKLLAVKPGVIVWCTNITDVILLLNYTDWPDIIHSQAQKTFCTETDFSQSIAERAKFIIRILVPNLYDMLYEFRKKAERHTPIKKDSGAGLRKLDHEDIERIKEQISLNLRLFIEICRSYHIVPVISTLAIHWSKGGNYKAREIEIFRILEKEVHIPLEEFIALVGDVNQMIREYCRREHILLADLDVAIPKGERYIYDFAHYTDEGSQKVAQCFFSVINSALQF